ncbi:hypothetical protein GOBAR_AA34588 [Gossypium barbadense]|uniref:Uncharacterized protein n=1 Tax=Gossypium barbadense TaxID=3634 RepID=A0A2P5W4S1_GOSBA|nr:hypothetical protein GOBAR_AA34588 [Gossypium barbadense]
MSNWEFSSFMLLSPFTTRATLGSGLGGFAGVSDLHSVSGGRLEYFLVKVSVELFLDGMEVQVGCGVLKLCI